MIHCTGWWRRTWRTAALPSILHDAHLAIRIRKWHSLAAGETEDPSALRSRELGQGEIPLHECPLCGTGNYNDDHLLLWCPTWGIIAFQILGKPFRWESLTGAAGKDIQRLITVTHHRITSYLTRDTTVVPTHNSSTDYKSICKDILQAWWDGTPGKQRNRQLGEQLQLHPTWKASLSVGPGKSNRIGEGGRYAPPSRRSNHSRGCQCTMVKIVRRRLR